MKTLKIRYYEDTFMKKASIDERESKWRKETSDATYILQVCGWIFNYSYPHSRICNVTNTTNLNNKCNLYHTNIA